MGKVIHEGWSTSEDEIPQPVGVVMGRNLRPQPELSEREKVLKSIEEYCTEQKTHEATET